MDRPTSKTTLIIVLIAVLAIIAAVFLTHRADKNITPANVSEIPPLPAPTDWPSVKVRDASITDSASYYTISATYPVTKDDVITGYFKSFVDDNISQFKEDTSWAAGNGADVAPAEAASLSLTIKYREEKNNRVDNYVFDVDTYTGGAHDLQATKTFSFSATGQQITLDSIFIKGSAGLKTIVPYVKTQLAKAPGADQSMIDDGTTPTAANYQNFTVGNDSVTFIFDPYQVAPYSSGAQKVTVPVSVFKSVANPDVFGKQ